MSKGKSLIHSSDVFSKNDIDIRSPRSTFARNSGLSTSFNVGDLVPVYCDEVYPGDTFDLRTNMAIRLQTLITPPFDELFLDTYYFFVPYRLLWDKWKEFNGESSSKWFQRDDYLVPQLTVAATGTVDGGENSLLDYFGLPIHNVQGSYSVSRLPFNAYALIWNEFFRDVNLQDEVLIDTSSVNKSYSKDLSVQGGKLLKVNKLHDYFTSCLPNTQRGQAVDLIDFMGDIPVLPKDINIGTKPDVGISVSSVGSGQISDAYNAEVYIDGKQVNNYLRATAKQGLTPNPGDPQYLYFNNLWADIGASEVPPLTINDLRLGIVAQQMLELSARGGNRYTSMLLNFFGVTPADASLQRPELLGASRMPFDIRQIVQTSQTADTPLGTQAGVSLTNSGGASFVKSFSEHGLLIGLACARYHHTYGQGIPKMWLRKGKFDFYNPLLAHIGEQPVYSAEIFADGKNYTDSKKDVFGYQEAWADLRYKPSVVTAEMRPQASKTLASWNFADNYENVPVLSDTWIAEDKTNVDRTLAVTSKVANQIFGDFWIENYSTRILPVHSVPGLERI